MSLVIADFNSTGGLMSGEFRWKLKAGGLVDSVQKVFAHGRFAVGCCGRFKLCMDAHAVACALAHLDYAPFVATLADGLKNLTDGSSGELDVIVLAWDEEQQRVRSTTLTTYDRFEPISIESGQFLAGAGDAAAVQYLKKAYEEHPPETAADLINTHVALYRGVSAANEEVGSECVIFTVTKQGVRQVRPQTDCEPFAASMARRYGALSVADGTTYGKTKLDHLSGGKPVIDFSEGIHINKTLDYVSNGTRAAWDSTAQKTAAVDVNGNLLLKNVTNANGLTDTPQTNSTTLVDLPEMTQTITTHGKSVLIAFCTAFNIANNIGTGAYCVVRDGVQIGPMMKIVMSNSTQYLPAALTLLDTPTAGSHTYKIQWRTDAIAWWLRADGTNRSFQVVELG